MTKKRDKIMIQTLFLANLKNFLYCLEFDNKFYLALCLWIRESLTLFEIKQNY